MKKSKFIMLTLVAALALMGAGYAAWTQTFSINSIVQTGELFIKIENPINNLEVMKAGVYQPSTSGADYITLTTNPVATTDSEGKTTLASLTSVIDRMYPGTKVTSTLTFENLGTLKADAIVSGSVSNKDSQLWNDLVITVNGTVIAGAGDAKMTNLTNAIAYAASSLEPNSGVRNVTIVQELPITSTDNTENQNLTWNVNFTFEQFNVN